MKKKLTYCAIICSTLLAIGLDNKTIDSNENKNISGLKWQKDASWGGYFVTWIKDYDGNSSLLNAMIYSDNIYFAKAALDIGKDVFFDKLKGLGLGETIPFEYVRKENLDEKISKLKI